MNWDLIQKNAVSPYGVMATQHFCATSAGVEILEEGGNAFDALLAVSLALSVCEPQASGLGGHLMALIHIRQEGKTIAIDGSSRSPNRASPDTVTKKNSRFGYRSATVPSLLASLEFIRNKYATLPLRRLIEPAIRLAENGFPVSELQHRLIGREQSKFLEEPACGIFFTNTNQALPVNNWLKQPVLANTLQAISRKGILDFYQGDIAKRIEEDMIRHDGLIRRDDLENIPWPKEKPPLYHRFKDKDIYSFPHPGSGQVLLSILQDLHSLTYSDYDPDSPQGAVLLVRLFQKRYTERYQNLFSHPSTLENGLRQDDTVRKNPSVKSSENGETTSFSIMDRYGNAASVTQSVESVFGSCAAAPELGFLYNNSMSVFNYDNPSHPYYVRANLSPWGNAAPTIAFIENQPWLALGSPGSDRIVPAILEVMLRLERLSPLDAVSAPRFGCTPEGVVNLESPRMKKEIIGALHKEGFQLQEREAFAFYMGCIQLALKENHQFTGIADPRRDGSAQGVLL